MTGQVQIAGHDPNALRVPVLGPDGKLYVTTDENPGQILVFTPSSARVHDGGAVDQPPTRR